MDNWKIVSRIAKVFGILFIVFTVLAAIISYELYTTMYSSAAPATFIAMSILTATLPYIVSAVLSFTVATLISRAIKPDIEKETETRRTQTEAKEEADLEKSIS